MPFVPYIRDGNDLTTPLVKELFLPDELLLHIFSFLKTTAWGVASLVSKQWKLLASADFLWLPFAYQLQPSLYPRNEKGSYDYAKKPSPKVATLALITLLKKNIDAELFLKKPTKTTLELNQQLNHENFRFYQNAKKIEELRKQSDRQQDYFDALNKAITAHIFLSRIGLGSLKKAKEAAEYDKGITENEKFLVSVACEFTRLGQYTTALEISKTLQDNNQGVILAAIVYKYIRNQQWQEALELAIQIPEKSYQRKELLFYMLCLALENKNMDLAMEILLKTKKLEHAFTVMNKCLEINDQRSVQLILGLYAKPFSEPKNYCAEKLVRIHIALGQYDKAEKIALFPQEDKYYNRSCLFALRNAYSKNNQPEKEHKMEKLLAQYPD